MQWGVWAKMGRTSARCTSWLGCLALVWLSILPASGRAEGTSSAAYARGLIAFHQARWNEALASFDRAVRLDAKDARARYYRGLTYARLGESRRAVEDIAAALELDPQLPHAALDLGIAHLSLEQWADAEAALERAYRAGEERWVSAFFLGIALYQQERLEEALPYFREAQQDPEVRAAAAYYAALIEIRLGRVQAARPLLETVIQTLPSSEIGLAAQQYLSRARGAVGVARGERPWSVFGQLGFEYDSNVTRGPKDQPPSVATDVTDKSDGRGVLSAGLRYSLLDDGQWSASFRYDVSQSVHFDLTRFDLQGHRLTADASYRSNAWRAGVGGGYAFYALDYRSFFHEGSWIPYLAWHASELAITQAFFRVRARDFLRRPFDPGRDAWNYAPGLRQFFSFGRADRVVSLGYQFEIEDTVSNGPQGRTFDYTAHELRADAQWGVAANLDLLAGYAFRSYSYRNRESGFGSRKRSDDLQEFALALRYPLDRYVSLTAAYIGQTNDSNVNVFEYDRHILSMGVQVTY